MWNKLKKMERWQQILVSLIIGIAVVSFWRGLWGLFDVYVSPSNPLIRFWFLFLAGFVVLVGTHHAVKEFG
ncbi:MAG: hypothetical protein Q8Q42_00870 [Nanoarchaeota archaeon]|nr:hypothetical protein [Nanoarchaeota archaeon]